MRTQQCRCISLPNLDVHILLEAILGHFPLTTSPILHVTFFRFFQVTKSRFTYFFFAKKKLDSDFHTFFLQAKT